MIFEVLREFAFARPIWVLSVNLDYEDGFSFFVDWRYRRVLSRDPFAVYFSVEDIVSASKKARYPIFVWKAEVESVRVVIYFFL